MPVFHVAFVLALEMRAAHSVGTMLWAAVHVGQKTLEVT